MIIDWVPAHFPEDGHGLARFDGSHVYEYEDPRRGWHPDWNSCIYDFGKQTVRQFLVANALFWLDKFHVDGLRVDAVASMLYLDYSRNEGDHMPDDMLKKIMLHRLARDMGVSMKYLQSFAWFYDDNLSILKMGGDLGINMVNSTLYNQKAI